MSPMDINHPQGKNEAFGRFYRENFKPLRAWLRRSGASAELSEDVVQQSMIEIWTKWEKIESPERLMRMIAGRNLMDAWRKQQRHPEDKLGDTEPTRWQDDTEAAYEAGRPEDIDRMLRAIDTLPRKQRLIMALTVDEWKPAEIAKELGYSSATTVRTNLHQARNKLRRELADPAEPARKEETWNSTTSRSTGSTARPSSST